MVKMTKIQPVCRLTSDLLTEHSPHPSYHAARIHTEKKNDQHFSLGDCWKLFLLFHVPFYDIFDKSNCFNFEVPIDKETNNPISGMIISSSNCSVHCVNISRYKLARINFFVAPKTFFPSQVALKLESAKQPKQVLKMEVSVVKIIFGFVSSTVHIMFIKIVFAILKINFKFVSSKAAKKLTTSL